MEPELCEDEGCPQYGTPHVCVATVKPSGEVTLDGVEAVFAAMFGEKE